jgi:hypothetical protein
MENSDVELIVEVSTRPARPRFIHMDEAARKAAMMEM